MSDYVQVPRGATEEMLQAVVVMNRTTCAPIRPFDIGHEMGWAARIWETMIAAAPQVIDDRKSIDEVRRLEDENERLNMAVIMFKASAERAGRVLLDVQQDCIAEVERLARERDEFLKNVGEQLLLAEQLGAERALAAAQAENEKLRDVLETAKSWLETWAAHVGKCRGGNVCTCGLTAVRYEISAALTQLSPEKE